MDIKSAHIFISGDPSVGIPNVDLHVELEADLEDESHREQLRAKLVELYEWLHGAPVGVRFNDECADCGAKGKHKCFTGEEYV